MSRVGKLYVCGNGVVPCHDQAREPSGITNPAAYVAAEFLLRVAVDVSTLCEVFFY